MSIHLLGFLIQPELPLQEFLIPMPDSPAQPARRFNLSPTWLL
jgi:hypothetical protein